jgi:CRP/FNR family cyclic AMP-dependent transcriptional regulator
MTLTRDRRCELLGQCRLFEGINDDDLDAVADRAAEVTFPAGRVIARQGEVGTGFFVVESGRVDVVRDGRIVASLGPGEFFGELSVLDGKPRNAQVVAAEDTTTLALASWDFERTVLEHPALALAILRGLAGRLRDATDHRA